MSDPPDPPRRAKPTGHGAPGARRRRFAGALLAASALGAGMLALALLIPPRQGVAASPGEQPFVDSEGWARLGSLQRADLRIDILMRAGERRYTVRREGRLIGERLGAGELRRRWGIDAEGLHAPGEATHAPVMMVVPESGAGLGR